MSFTETYRIAVIHKGTYNPATEYSVMDEVQYEGSSYRLKVAADAGTLPTVTDSWDLVSSKGDQGDAGHNSDVTRLSTSSQELATGLKIFSFSESSPNIGFQVNQRVRISQSSTNYMEGMLTNFNGSGCTVNIDYVVGTGTYADWKISIAGDVGNQGEQGESITSTTFSDSTGILTITVGAA